MKKSGRKSGGSRKKGRYRIRYSEEARRSLRKLPGRYRQRVRRLIESLAETPRPNHAKELRDLPDVYRIWVNGWRLIFLFYYESEIVLIVGIRRKTGPETYEELPVEF